MTLLVFILVLLVPFLAFAESDLSGEQAWWATLLEVLLSALAPVIAVFAGLALRWVAKKFRAQATAEELAMVQSVAALATGYAEEFARRKIKEAGKKASSNEKLNVAVCYAADLIERWGLPKQGATALVKIIESSLGRERGTKTSAGKEP